MGVSQQVTYVPSDGFDLVSLEAGGHVDAVVLAVAHDQFKSLGQAQLKAICGNGNGCGVVLDVKNLLGRDEVEGQGMEHWSL